MMQFLDILQYLVLTLWVGAMFAFGAIYAPVLFRNLSSRDQAGQIAGETLARIGSVGLVAGGIMVVVTLLQAMEGAWTSVLLGRILLAGAMLALELFGAITIRPRLAGVRQQMGRPIDDLGENDPLRVEYRKYHRISRGLFSLNLLLGVGLIVLSALR